MKYKYQTCSLKTEERRKKHRCYRCPWGKDTGGTYFCMLPRCMPKLGSFGGVKNAKQEDIHQDAKELL